MRRSIRTLVYLLALGLGLACMPIVPTPEPPTPRLDKAQLKSVLKCQTGVLKAGAKFVSKKIKGLESCAAGVLKVRLAFDNELLTETEYQAGLAKARAGCDRDYGKITKASSKFVDGVIKSCQPVEQFLLDNDSLAFQYIAVEGFLPPATTLVELAGSLCTAKELLADQLVFFQMPRLLELLTHLGPEYVVLTDSKAVPPLGLPVIPLDPRCPDAITPPTF